MLKECQPTQATCTPQAGGRLPDRVWLVVDGLSGRHCLRGALGRDGRENLEPVPTPRPSPSAIGGEGPKVLIGWNTGDCRFEANRSPKPPREELHLRQPSLLRPAAATDRPPRLDARAVGRQGRPLQPTEQPAEEDQQDRRHQSFTVPAAKEACYQVSQYKTVSARPETYRKSFGPPARAVEDTPLQRMILEITQGEPPQNAFRSRRRQLRVRRVPPKRLVRPLLYLNNRSARLQLLRHRSRSRRLCFRSCFKTGTRL